MTMFMVLSYDQSHCESSPSSSDECGLSAGWPPTLKPSQSTWAGSPPKIGSYVEPQHTAANAGSAAVTADIRSGPLTRMDCCCLSR